MPIQSMVMPISKDYKMNYCILKCCIIDQVGDYLELALGVRVMVD